MVKGGDKMLFKLMEAESGLSGNTLAVSARSHTALNTADVVVRPSGY